MRLVQFIPLSMRDSGWTEGPTILVTSGENQWSRSRERRSVRWGTSGVDVAVYTNNFHAKNNKNGGMVFNYLDTWNNETGFRSGVNLYPDKMEDLMGKELRVISLDYPPYSVFNDFGGFEGSLVKEFCVKHNCSLDVVEAGDGKWGAVYYNLTGDGIFGKLITAQADIGAAAMGIWLYESMFFDYSISYFRAVVTCLVPKPQPLPKWMVPFLPFSMAMWLSLLVSMSAAALSLGWVTGMSHRYTRHRDQLSKQKQFFTLSDSFLRALGLVVLQSPSIKMVGSSPTRHLFTSFELLFLFMMSCYTAGLESYLTVPTYYPPIDTLQDLHKSGLHWLAEHEAYVYSLLFDTDKTVIELRNRFMIEDNTKELIKMGLSGKYGLAMEILPDGSFSDREHVTMEVITNSHLMKGRLYDTPIGICFQKGSPYLSIFNDFTHTILDSGIFVFWMKEAARKYLSHRKQSALIESRDTRKQLYPIQLRVGHVQGAFALYFAGIALSLVALDTLFLL